MLPPHLLSIFERFLDPWSYYDPLSINYGYPPLALSIKCDNRPCRGDYHF